MMMVLVLSQHELFASSTAHIAVSVPRRLDLVSVRLNIAL